MPVDSAGDVVYDPRIALDALLGRARIDDRRAALKQNNEQFAVQADQANAQLKLQQDKAKIEAATAKLEQDFNQLRIQQGEQQLADMEVISGGGPIGGVGPPNPARQEAINRQLLQGNTQGVGLVEGLQSGAIDLDKLTRIAQGLEPTAGAELQATVQREQIAVSRDLGTTDAFIRAAGHNLDVRKYTQSLVDQTNAMVAGLFQNFPAVRPYIAMGAFKGVSNPADILQLAAGLPGIDGKTVANMSTQVFDRTLALLDNNAKQVRNSITVGGQKADLAGKLLDFEASVFATAAKNLGSADMSDAGKKELLRSLWLYGQANANILTELGVFGENPHALLPPKSKELDKAIGPRTVEDAVEAELPPGRFNLNDPAETGAVLPYALGLGGLDLSKLAQQTPEEVATQGTAVDEVTTTQTTADPAPPPDQNDINMKGWDDLVTGDLARGLSLDSAVLREYLSLLPTQRLEVAKALLAEFQRRQAQPTESRALDIGLTESVSTAP